MKILQIASGDFFSTYGGGQVYVKNIVDEMIRQGLDVTVLSFVGKDIAINECEYKEIALWEIGAHATSSDIEELVQSISPNIIHAHSRKALFVSLGELLHIPVVVTAHHGGILCPAGSLMNAEECICQTTLSHEHCLKCCMINIRTGRSWYPLMKLLSKKAYIGLGKALEKVPFIPFISPIGSVALSIENKQKEWQTICDKATIVVAPSYAIADAMCRNGLSRDKIKVIPHGIPKNMEIHNNYSSKNNREEGVLALGYKGKIRFFYVGRLGRLKGIHILLEAFSRLDISKTELHIVGEAGHNKASRRYMRMLLKKYTNPNVFWHGKVAPAEVFNAIKDFDVMVHPAIYLEVFGLNIAEALAMNKPVLATRCGGAEMQIVENVNGWLVAPNDVEVLHEKLVLVVEKGVNMNISELHHGVVSIYEHVNDLKEIYKIECNI